MDLLCYLSFYPVALAGGAARCASTRIGYVQRINEMATAIPNAAFHFDRHADCRYGKVKTPFARRVKAVFPLGFQTCQVIDFPFKGRKVLLHRSNNQLLRRLFYRS